jgi:hypothetical protein
MFGESCYTADQSFSFNLVTAIEGAFKTASSPEIFDNLIEHDPYAAGIIMYLSAWCYSNQADIAGLMARAGVRGIERASSSLRCHLGMMP